MRPILKKDKDAFIEAFLEARNPFQENGNGLIHIIFKHFLDEKMLQILSEKLQKIEEFFVERIQYKTKSDFLVYFNGLAGFTCDHKNVGMEVIGVAAFVNMNPPAASNTYGECCDMELNAKILRIADGLQRVGIAFDTYQRNTIKSDTRHDGRKNIRFSALQDTPVYKKCQDFMRCDDNKHTFSNYFQ